MAEQRQRYEPDVPRCGHFLVENSHAYLIAYRATKPVRPHAASSLVPGSPLSVFMITLYAASRVLRCQGKKVMDGSREVYNHLKPVMPMRPGICVLAIVKAEPVMKPLTAGAGMNSTSHPSLKRPKPKVINPVITARLDAMTCPSQTPGCLLSTEAMI
jgi:hypothetical protein